MEGPPGSSGLGSGLLVNINRSKAYLEGISVHPAQRSRWSGGHGSQNLTGWLRTTSVRQRCPQLLLTKPNPSGLWSQVFLLVDPTRTLVPLEPDWFSFSADLLSSWELSPPSPAWCFSSLLVGVINGDLYEGPLEHRWSQ